MEHGKMLWRALVRTLSTGLVLLSAATAAQAQHGAMDFGMMYTQERSRFVGTDTGDNYFYLRGASFDLASSMWKGFGPAVSATGLAASNERGNIDIHHIELLGGLRYTRNWGHITPTVITRRMSLFAEAKAGYTFATSGLYPVNGIVQDHASALTYAGGGGFNLHAYQRFDLRLVDVQYVISKLPNGSTNQQNTLRFGAGLNFHFGP
ncbi:MAG: hypothetical protein PW735_06630 [Acidobacteriaceae bacterium]|nr:hypothetical protein [Acidobacteriaceae bacterium]